MPGRLPEPAGTVRRGAGSSPVGIATDIPPHDLRESNRYRGDTWR